MLRVVVFAEAEADARLGCDLGDRVLVEEGPDWIGGLSLDHLRHWTAADGTLGFTKWTHLLREVGKKRGPRYLRRHTSAPAGSDYAMAVKALLYVRSRVETEAGPLAVMMLRDCDTSSDKREGLRQAATEERFVGLNVIVGIADKMREAWVLNGFVARDAAERKSLSALARDLGFDPVGQAHRLRSARESDPRHPKHVLAQLTGGVWDRETLCWTDTPLSELRDRGRRTGLTDFLDTLHKRLLQLVTSSY